MERGGLRAATIQIERRRNPPAFGKTENVRPGVGKIVPTLVVLPGSARAALAD